MKTSVLTIIAVVFLMGSTVAQSSSNIPLIGSKAPSFSENSTQGKFTFPNDFGKSWKVLFSHPQDFTPVCSSELLELANMQGEFDKLGVKIAIISTDNVEQHNLWASYLDEIDYKDHGKQEIKFPIISDTDKNASKLYGMLHEPTSAVLI